MSSLQEKLAKQWNTNNLNVKLNHNKIIGIAHLHIDRSLPSPQLPK